MHVTQFLRSIMVVSVLLMHFSPTHSSTIFENTRTLSQLENEKRILIQKHHALLTQRTHCEAFGVVSHFLSLGTACVERCKKRINSKLAANEEQRKIIDFLLNQQPSTRRHTIECR